MSASTLPGTSAAHVHGAYRGRRGACMLLGVLALVLCRAGIGADHSGVDTRFGRLDAQADSPAGHADILFRGAPLGQLDGSISLYKLPVRDASDYVIADAFSPGLHCPHRYTLLQVGPGDEATMSQPFGECLTLVGARSQDGQPVVQLAGANVPDSQQKPAMHEFMWTQDRITELPRTQSPCDAAPAAATAGGTPVDAAQAARIVTGAGRAYFHTAPLEACRLPSLFIVPGDRVTVLHIREGFADITYHNPRTGRQASGWIRLDRLAAQADAAPDAAH